MSFAALLHHDVVIFNLVDPGSGEETTDRYGNPIQEWDDGEDASAWIQPRDSREFLNDRDTRLSSFVGFFPVTASITGTSEVEHDGQRYRVVGRPRPIDNSTGPHHLEVDLDLVEGG